MNWIASLTLYLIICFAAYEIIKNQYRKYAISSEMQCDNTPPKKIRFVAIIFISILFTLYNVYLTTTHLTLSQDRSNYAIEFSGIRSVGSAGTEFVFTIIKFLGGDIYTVFYFSTFFCVLLTLIAYRENKEANYRLFPLLMISEWFFYTVTAIKQCYACAFAALFFVYILNDSKKRNTVIALVCAILAFLFHTSGAILFPIFIAIKIKKERSWKTPALLLLVIICIFNLKNILLIVSGLTSSLLPILSSKIANYMIEGEGAGEGSVLSIIKWVPFYYTVIMGFAYRKGFRDIINHYDDYLIITSIASGLALFSAISYWFYRFVAIFYVPVFIYYNLLNDNVRTREERMMNNFIVYGSSIVVFIRWFILVYIKYGGF